MLGGLVFLFGASVLVAQRHNGGCRCRKREAQRQNLSANKLKSATPKLETPRRMVQIAAALPPPKMQRQKRLDILLLSVESTQPSQLPVAQLQL